MADPFSLSVLGAAVAGEGIKFLFRQAEALIGGWRERRRQARGADQENRLEVPLQPSPSLQGTPTATSADLEQVGEVAPEIQSLGDDLYRYAVQGEPVDVDDADLARRVNRLRQLLEAVYGERLTFAGENRQPTGTSLDIEQRVRILRGGGMIGVDTGAIGPGASVTIDQTVDTAENATIIGGRNLTIGAVGVEAAERSGPNGAPLPAIAERWRSDLQQIQHNREAARAGHLDRINDEQALARREQRLAERGLDLEGIVKDDDSLWSQFLAGGLRAAESVGRVVSSRRGSPPQWLGTAVLVADRLVLTNHHVLGDPEVAATAVIQFDYDYDEDGAERQEISVPCDVDRAFFADVALDFAVVALAAEPALTGRRTVSLVRRAGKALLGERVNVIHHPGGERKRVSIRANRLVSMDDDWLRYTSDTRHGSSGSPVFNDQWEMVALHHGGFPDPAAPADREAATANEGARVSRIVAALLAADLPDAVRAVVDAAIADRVGG